VFNKMCTTNKTSRNSKLFFIKEKVDFIVKTANPPQRMNWYWWNFTQL